MTGNREVELAHFNGEHGAGIFQKIGVQRLTDLLALARTCVEVNVGPLEQFMRALTRPKYARKGSKYCYPMGPSG